MNSRIAPTSERFTAVIDDVELDFYMSAYLIEHATAFNELDQWRIILRTSLGAESRFDYMAGMEERNLRLPLRPDPIHVLGKIGADVAIAIRFPTLYWTKINEVKDRVEILLIGSGVTAEAFARWSTQAYADAQNPRRTKGAV